MDCRQLVIPTLILVQSAPRAPFLWPQVISRLESAFWRRQPNKPRELLPSSASSGGVRVQEPPARGGENFDLQQPSKNI